MALEGAPPDPDDPNLSPPENPDRLDVLTAMMRRARSLRLEAKDLETRRKAVNTELNDLIYTRLPDLFAQTGTTHYAVAPEGNMPGYEGRLKSYHKAAISAEWEQERQVTGYAMLRELGGVDLIRNTVTASFDRGEDARAVALMHHLASEGINYEQRAAVHWSTLTAWLREQCTRLQREFTHEQLEAIGATVGHVVEVKQVK